MTNPFETNPNTKCSIQNDVAERVEFEPTVPVRVQRFSRPSDSTTLAPLRESLMINVWRGKYQVAATRVRPLVNDAKAAGSCTPAAFAFGLTQLAAYCSLSRSVVAKKSWFSRFPLTMMSRLAGEKVNRLPFATESVYVFPAGTFVNWNVPKWPV